MKKYLLVFITLFCSPYIMAQQNAAVLDRIVEKLEAGQQARPLEKVYLQTDKEVYAPGEIIWFAALIYDRTSNSLSAVSPEITVNLYDAAGNFITGDLFAIRGGKSNGDLLIPAELPLGRYYLAAYTPLQVRPENVSIISLIVHRYYESDALITSANSEIVYPSGKEATINLLVNDFNGKPVDKFTFNYEIRLGDKKLDGGKARSSFGKSAIRTAMPAETGGVPVALLITHPKNLWTKKLALRTTADRLEVKFYPEGGVLLKEVPQKMGYYVTAWNGTPVQVEADVIDNGGKLLSKTKTYVPGFGLFPIKAEDGVKTKLLITSEYGKGQTFEMPQPSAEGVALTVPRTDSLSVLADILVSGGAKRSLNVTATRGYALLWATNLNVSSNARVRIPVSDLGYGLIQLNVFDESAKLLSTRLVYVPDRVGLKVHVSAEPPADGKMKVTVRTTDIKGNPVPSEVLLSIADKMRRPDHANMIGTYLNFNGELKNPLPADDTRESKMEGTALDYFLISNELKSFSWDKVLSEGEAQEDVFLNSMGISGKVSDRKGAPVTGAKISILNSRDMQMYTATADEKGHFNFPSLQPVNIKDFNITATDMNGKGSMNVDLDPTFAQRVGQKAKMMDFGMSAWEQPVINLTGYLSANPDLLSEQQEVRPINTGGGRQQSESYKTLLQTATSLQEVIRSIKPFTLINNQIVFAGTMNSFNAQTGALIVVDGQKMGTQVDVLNTISPYDVEKINISMDPMDIQKYSGFNNVGLIEIFLKKGMLTVGETPAKVQESSYSDGLRIPRNFLTTDGLEGKDGKDLRTTLYWDPSLKIGSSGSTTFSIPVSGVKSVFVIKATGITENGKTGEGEISVEVKK